MKTCILFLLASLLWIQSLFPQNVQHESVVVNIEIPVRVFQGDRFVDDLTLKDFQIFEDGVPQTLDAVYLIRDSSIKSEDIQPVAGDQKKRYSPRIARKFVFVFELQDYPPKMDDVIDDFFTRVLLPGDSLIVLTPMKSYNLKIRASTALTPRRISEQLKSILRKDTIQANARYHSIIRELLQCFVSGGPFHDSPGNSIIYIEDLYQEWLTLKVLEEHKLLEFADTLQDFDGQKHIFLFYQKEVLPQLNWKVLEYFRDKTQAKPHYYSKLNDLFSYCERGINFDIPRIKAAFSDASLCCHFLYLARRQPYELDVSLIQTSGENVSMMEKTAQIFSAFKEVAQATGGIVESSANAGFMFDKAVEATENYYLLYYSPLKYTPDGQFKKIRIRIKGGNGFRVHHRFGYYSD